jgi:thiamine-phosphate pyrophosphorylase
MPRAPDCRLYLISPPRIDDLAGFADLALESARAGEAACFQLRLKDVSDGDVEAAAQAIFPRLQAHGVACLINDRPDLVAATGADGVHIGQSDMPYKAARALVGADTIIGVTCHGSRHLAMEAAERGADYVAFGAFYPSTTKLPPAMAEADILDWWQVMMEVPCVAIGGITPDNCLPLIEAGADFLALSAGIWDWPAGPVSAARALRQTCQPG